MKKLTIFMMFFFLKSAFAIPAFQMEPVSRQLKSQTSSNVIIKKCSNWANKKLYPSYKRTINYPTQVVRTEAELKGAPQNCNEIMNKIEKFFSELSH